MYQALSKKQICLNSKDLIKGNLIGRLFKGISNRKIMTAEKPGLPTGLREPGER
jgi:hypothetical protein